MNAMQKYVRHSYVVFDPSDAEHLVAARMLITMNRMHPSIRFIQTTNHQDVRSMLMEQVATHYLSLAVQ